MPSSLHAKNYRAVSRINAQIGPAKGQSGSRDFLAKGPKLKRQNGRVGVGRQRLIQNRRYLRIEEREACAEKQTVRCRQEGVVTLIEKHVEQPDVPAFKLERSHAAMLPSLLGGTIGGSFVKSDDAGC